MPSLPEARHVPVGIGRPARPRQEQRKDFPREQRRRGLGRQPRRRRHVLLDPARGDDARIGLRQLLVVPDRVGQRDDQEQQSHRHERAEAAGEHPEHGDDREQVAVEVRVQGEQVGEVDDHEGDEDEVSLLAGDDRDDEPRHGDEQRRADRVPELAAEGEERPAVVLEAEPAVACKPLHARSRRPRPASGGRARTGSWPGRPARRGRSR